MVTFQEIYYSRRNECDKNKKLINNLHFLLWVENVSFHRGTSLGPLDSPPARALRLIRSFGARPQAPGAMEQLSSLAQWSGGSWPLNHPRPWLWQGLQALWNCVSLPTDRKAQTSCQVCWGLAGRASVWCMITQLLAFISRPWQPEQELHSRLIITSPHTDITFMSITDYFQNSSLGTHLKFSVIPRRYQFWSLRFRLQISWNKPMIENRGKKSPSMTDLLTHRRWLTPHGRYFQESCNGTFLHSCSQQHCILRLTYKS